MNRLALITALAVTSGLHASDKPGLLQGDIQDMVFLSNGGPVKLRMHVFVHGTAASTAWEKAINAHFDHFDRNSDGKIDDKEYALMPEPPNYFYNSAMARPVVAGRPMPPALTTAKLEDVDSDKDGVVSRAEYLAYMQKVYPPLRVTHRQQPFVGQVVFAGQTGPTNPADVTRAMMKLLDRNGDGKLSKEELLDAPASLMRLDRNEDEIITPQELLQQAASPGLAVSPIEAMQPTPTRPAQMSPFVVLARDQPNAASTAAQELLRRLDRDKNRSLSRQEFNLSAEAFKAADRDENGELDGDELAAWLKTPDLQLRVQIGTIFMNMNLLDDFIPPIPLFDGVSVWGKSDLSKRTRRDSEGSLWLTLSDALLTVPRVESTTGYFDNTTFFVQQFEEQSKGKKGLTQKEFGENQFFRGMASVFARMDRDSNGTLTKDEFRKFMELAKLVTSAQQILMIHEQGRGLFDILDTNRDSRLGLREMRAAPGLLTDWDTNRDGLLAEDELPRQFRLEWSQGQANPGGPIRVFFGGRMVSQAPPPGRGPVWFRKMDRNGDGDVSLAEFLGSIEAFRSLDKDGDGLISLAEAEAAVKEKR